MKSIWDAGRAIPWGGLAYLLAAAGWGLRAGRPASEGLLSLAGLVYYIMGLCVGTGGQPPAGQS